jgi:hypothetical protein
MMGKAGGGVDILISVGGPISVSDGGMLAESRLPPGYHSPTVILLPTQAHYALHESNDSIEAVSMSKNHLRLPASFPSADNEPPLYA